MSRKQQPSGLSTGEKIGIAAGVATALGAVGALLYKALQDSQETEEKAPTQGWSQLRYREISAYPEEKDMNGQNKNTIETLESVLKKIKLDKSELKQQNEKLRKLIDFIISGLKGDALFQKIYKDIRYCGSFYEKLKISAPDEFDLNIVLQLPIKQEDLEITSKGSNTGSVCIKNFREKLEEFCKNNPYKSIYSKMLKWCNEKGNLEQDAVLRWMESILSIYLTVDTKNMLKRSMGLNDLKICKSGPSMKLIVDDISIDLVAAIEFTGSPPSPFTVRCYSQFAWYAIPKPHPGRNDVWRLSFCLHEQEVLKNRGTLKPAIRLIKKMRDTHNWKNLYSYYIKTVAIWAVYNNRTTSKVDEMRLDDMFFFLLEKLQECLESNSLRSFWDPRVNLLDDWSAQHRNDVANELRNLIRKMKNTENPSKIAEVILGKLWQI